MNIKISTFHSYLHESTSFNMRNNSFIKDVEDKLNEKINYAELDDYDCDIKLIFIESGGSEGFFLENIDKLKEPYYLITSGDNNSLAASLEIITYLNQQGLKGEILHGSSSYIASRIKELALVNKIRNELNNVNLGVIGTPSDWLISSIPNYDDVKEKMGINLIDIPLSELESYALKENDYSINKDIKFDENELKKAISIYKAFEKIKYDYKLDGITIRCFDLLTSLKSTGCLGLALLNEEGIIGTCEGDIMAMITMEIVKKVANVSSFQANPSRINVEDNTMVLAHCTIPFDMVSNVEYMTHFESKSGLAIRGKLSKTDITVVRISANLKDFYVDEGVILDNLEEENLCRTQIKVKMNNDVSVLLKKPCGNHHIVFYGKYKNELETILKELLK